MQILTESQLQTPPGALTIVGFRSDALDHSGASTPASSRWRTTSGIELPIQTRPLIGSIPAVCPFRCETSCRRQYSVQAIFALALASFSFAGWGIHTVKIDTAQQSGKTVCGAGRWSKNRKVRDSRKHSESPARQRHALPRPRASAPVARLFAFIRVHWRSATERSIRSGRRGREIVRNPVTQGERCLFLPLCDHRSYMADPIPADVTQLLGQWSAAIARRWTTLFRSFTTSCGACARALGAGACRPHHAAK